MGSKMFEREEGNQSCENRATILGIGTAVPPNCLYQTQYPDFYFRVTNSQHMTHLTQKFKHICEKSRIHKRHFHLNEEILKANPNICKYGAPSLDARQEMMVKEVPKLGKEAALKAIEEWGQPVSRITHLIFCTNSSISMPGPDCQLSKLLGLKPSVGRFVLYQHGCFAVGTALRLAKDVAENNVNARVLVVAVDMLSMYFHAPSETHLDILVGQALFSDGAAAVIIGANPKLDVERPLFQMVSASQALLPDSEDGVTGIIKEMGLSYNLSRYVPKYVGQNIRKCLVEACPVEILDFNSMFYIIHPGGPAILDQIEQSLGLEEGKLEASRHVLQEYGNMAAPTVLFILDEMRKKSMREGKNSTGEGLEWGVLVALGPGLTLETLMLHSVSMR